MPLTVEDLEPFCSTNPRRGVLQAPWSRDGFTYSTDGHIAVRVARLPDVAELEHAPEAAKIFALTAGQDVAPLPPFEVPEPEHDECEDCDGRGTQHDCPYCDCVCKTCGGAGMVWQKMSVGLRGALFAAHYVERMRELPGVAFSTAPPPAGPARFVFTGGEGALMPLSSRYERHLEVAEGQ